MWRGGEGDESLLSMTMASCTVRRDNAHRIRCAGIYCTYGCKMKTVYFTTYASYESYLLRKFLGHYRISDFVYPPFMTQIFAVCPILLDRLQLQDVKSEGRKPYRYYVLRRKLASYYHLLLSRKYSSCHRCKALLISP